MLGGHSISGGTPRRIGSIDDGPSSSVAMLAQVHGGPTPRDVRLLRTGVRSCAGNLAALRCAHTTPPPTAQHNASRPRRAARTATHAPANLGAARPHAHTTLTRAWGLAHTAMPRARPVSARCVCTQCCGPRMGGGAGCGRGVARRAKEPRPCVVCAASGRSVRLGRRPHCAEVAPGGGCRAQT